MSGKRTAALVGLVALVMAACLTAAPAARRELGSEQMAGVRDGLPDTGMLAIETNRRLDEVNANLKELNTKLQAILDLLRSGRVEVVTVEKGTPPRGAND